MARFNNKKLQAQRNFQSIWHSHPEYIEKLLKEDQLIREYIIGTMKAKEWKLSEIIIKRKVKQIHIAFQIQNKIVKERKKWTKNRLKNRIRALKGLKRTRTSGREAATIKKRYLFFQLFLMATELRKMYPNNIITFYIQKTKPLQFNANLVSSWIIANMNKKKSYKRLLNKVIRKYKKGVEKTKPSFKTINSTWNNLKKKTKKNFLTWITGNLIYIYNTHNLIKRSHGYDKNQDLGPIGPVAISSKNKWQDISKKISSDKPLTKRPFKSLRLKHRYKKAPFYFYWLKIKRDLRRKKLKGFLPGVKVLKKYYNSKQKNSNKGKMGALKGNSAKFKNLQDISKRNIYTLRCFNSFFFNSSCNSFNTKNPILPLLVSAPKINPTSFRKLYSDSMCLYSQFYQFNPLSFDQIFSNFISHRGSEMTKKVSDRQSSMNSDDLIIRGSTFNKLLLYYLIIQIYRSALLNKSKLTTSKSYNLIGQVAEMGKKDKFNINQDLRTTWKLTRKLPRIQRRLGKVRRYLWKQHRNEFNDDILFLLNYYKYRNYTNALSITSRRDDAINFLWQGKNFIKFLQLHPPLLDHVIKCLIAIPILNYASNDNINLFTNKINFNDTYSDQLIAFLTHVWIGFFDYISHFENSLSKWQGIKINLKGRIGFKKMGRAKKYSNSWGVCKNSSASLPLQYSYSQIHTRYGAVSMRIFIR